MNERKLAELLDLFSYRTELIFRFFASAIAKGNYWQRDRSGVLAAITELESWCKQMAAKIREDEEK